MDTNIKKAIFLVVIIGAVLACGQSRQILFSDDFSGYEPGSFMPHVGPHTEYHFIKEAQATGAWVMTAFQSRWMDTAWRINRAADGAQIMSMTVHSKPRHSHPMLVIAADSLWRDYTAEVIVTPHTDKRRTGMAFRYHNDRCYYYFGMEDQRVSIVRVKDEISFHIPDEDTLAIAEFLWEPGRTYALSVEVQGNRFVGRIDGVEVLCVEDNTYTQGQIALLTDNPADYHRVIVTADPSEIRRVENRKAEIIHKMEALQASNPKMVLWKKIDTPEFGTGRNLRFGDLNGDGQPDVLIGQILQHAYPLDRFSELSCLTAMTFDGEILWQKGEPVPEKYELTNDVAFQIFDIDRDGNNEVIYTMNCTIWVADGATGEIKYSAPTPAKKATMYFMDDKSKPMRDFDRILGDCLYICDLQGAGYPGDIVIKDRYEKFWVLDNKLQIRWSGECKTGHYPYAADLDGDGRNELLMGYSAYDGDGKKLWSWDDQIKDHCDGVAAVDFGIGTGEKQLRIFNAASDEGVIIATPDGQICKHHRVGHAQNPAIADFRPDLPGLEAVVVNFWGNQGIIHFFDKDGNIYYDFEPTNYGSMCLPINWRGDGQEFFVLNANVKEGGLYDGWGRRVVAFPDDGHPDMCNAVLDITGDVRDEIVVWDMHSIWVYTQDDSPKSGKLYKPNRNPLWNYSNYQLTVSLPGWTE